MKKILFPEDWVKLTTSRKEQLQEKLVENNRDSDNIKNILLVDEKRKYIADYWNSLSETDRKNIGKSKDEIENGHNAQFHSVISYENVGHLKFEELDDYWQGTFLSSCAEASIELLKECTAKKSLTV
jgi:ribosomal protein S15P/S13E